MWWCVVGLRPGEETPLTTHQHNNDLVRAWRVSPLSPHPFSFAAMAARKARARVEAAAKLACSPIGALYGPAAIAAAAESSFENARAGIEDGVAVYVNKPQPSRNAWRVGRPGVTTWPPHSITGVPLPLWDLVGGLGGLSAPLYRTDVCDLDFGVVFVAAGRCWC